MRFLLALFFPLLIQAFAFVAVFVASRGGGSFMGLLALPVAPLSLLALLAFGISGVRGGRPLAGVMVTTWTIAVVPPVALLIIHALES